jgi:hypothetical protein
MPAGGINLFGVVSDSIDRERLNQTYAFDKNRYFIREAALILVLDAAVHFIHPDLAVLHWTWSINGDGGEDPRTHAPRRGIFTMLVQKRGDAWLISVAQNINERPGPNPELDGIKPPIAFPPTR